MVDVPSLSRRQALALVGGAATGVGGFAVGVRSADSLPDWLAGRDCDPAPFVTSPTDWPFPLHDRANTAHAPARAGPDWPAEQVWEREWPTGVVANVQSPVAADGLAVVLIQNQAGASLLGLSLSDGHISWRHPVAQSDHGLFFAAGGLVFGEVPSPGSDDSFVVRSLADGEPHWTHDSLDPWTLTGGRLFTIEHLHSPREFESRTVVRAHDARTGVKCWRAVHEGIAIQRAVADGRLVLATFDKGIFAIDPVSGEQQWRSNATGNSAAITDGRVISESTPAELTAVSLADGTVEWYAQNEDIISNLPGHTEHYPRLGFDVGAVTPEAIIYQLLVGNDRPSRLRARDPATGDLLWDVGPDYDPVERHDYSQPIVVGDDVLVVRYASREGADETPDALLRIGAGAGNERDRVTFPNERVFSPIVADGALLVPTTRRLIAYR